MAASEGAAGLGSPLSGPAARCWRVFPSASGSVPALRQWLSALLPASPARADLLLIGTELATNAVTHTASRGSLFAVEVACYAHAVRVTVADRGAPEGPRLVRDPAAEHGRGLHVIQALSARAGVTGNHRGRQVWAEVSWPGASDASQEAADVQAIRDSESWLASRLPGTAAWYGRATCQWWAMAGGALISAPTARELARLLGIAPPPPRLAAATPGPAGPFPSRELLVTVLDSLRRL